jgi:Carbohydrate-selective porin, OprB family
VHAGKKNDVHKMPNWQPSSRQLSGDMGAWGVFEQQIYRVPNSDDRGIGLFGRISGAPADHNLIDLYADAGIEFIGLNEKRPVTDLASQLATHTFRSGLNNSTAIIGISQAPLGRNVHLKDCSPPSTSIRSARVGRCSRTSSTSSIQAAGRQIRRELFRADC